MIKKLHIWFWWLPLLTAGCAQTVQVTSRAPRTPATGRTQRVAVLSVDGPEQHTAIATQRLVQKLRQSGLYEVVDEQSLQQAAPEILRDEQGKLRKHVAGAAGRRMRLDGLLVSSLRTRDSRKEMQLRFGHPVVSATTMYTWVELPSGRLRDSNQAQHGQPTTGAGGDPLRECIEESVDKLAKKLAPNLETVSRELVGSKWFGDLSEGNRLAADNNWQAAKAAWDKATREDPDNDGAWYNLGIAAEAQGDHRLALRRYLRAIQINNREDYQLAYQRLESTLSSQQIASRQVGPDDVRNHIPSRQSYPAQPAYAPLRR